MSPGAFDGLRAGWFALVYGFSQRCDATPVRARADPSRIALSVVRSCPFVRSSGSRPNRCCPRPIVLDRGRGGPISRLRSPAQASSGVPLPDLLPAIDLHFSPVNTRGGFLPLTAVLVVTSTFVPTRVLDRTAGEAADRRRHGAGLIAIAPFDAALAGAGYAGHVLPALITSASHGPPSSRTADQLATLGSRFPRPCRPRRGHTARMSAARSARRFAQHSFCELCLLLPVEPCALTGTRERLDGPWLHARVRLGGGICAPSCLLALVSLRSSPAPSPPLGAADEKPALSHPCGGPLRSPRRRLRRAPDSHFAVTRSVGSRPPQRALAPVGAVAPDQSRIRK